jgi:hypothetical protein
MKYAVEMGSGARIHTKFHKDRFMHSKVDKVGYTNTHRQHGDCISLLLFFQNKERRPKNALFLV